METMKTVPNRMYKATVFAMLFEDKKRLLELYNAISGKHYTDPDMLEINTLENAIYMAVKNDISFLIDARLSLYEHQSTYSPNLPLRFLLYISSLFSSMTKELNLYGTKPIELPTPQFVVFYNGLQEQPDRKILKLSDLYTVKGECNLELEAVEKAIEECIREGILKEFLEKNKAEARNMSIFEYDQEKHLRQEITGIVANEKLQVPKNYRRRLRQECYYIRKFGLENHLSHIEYTGDKQKYLQRLLGKIQYVLQINPEDGEFCEWKRWITNSFFIHD